MRFQTLGNARQFGGMSVKSDEATLTIKKGSPVFLKATGVKFGLSVVSAVSQAAATQGFFVGLALADILPGQVGDVHSYGMFAYARVIIASRSASDAVWASYSAGALGDVMAIVTATNTDVQAIIRTGAGSASIAQGWALQLAETYASETTQASDLVGASLYSTTTLKMMVRAF